MDPDSSFNLEMRIVVPNSRARWFCVNEVVDADRTHFSGMLEDVVDKYPPNYGDVASLFYFCRDSKVHIPIRSDQELVEMFDKHRVYRSCWLTVAYHKENSEPPVLPNWDFGEPNNPAPSPDTPTIPEPTPLEPSQTTNTDQAGPSQPSYDDDHNDDSIVDDDGTLANPNPMFEHVGVDDESLYIDLGPQYHPAPPNRSTGRKQREEEVEEEVEEEEEEEEDSSGDEMLSDSDANVDDVSDDEIVADRVPEPKPDAHYDKKDPPMSVGTIYSNMAAFKIALASHSAKHEYHYLIEKSDPGRYRVYCKYKDEFNCPWRIHASTLRDGVTVKVISSWSSLFLPSYIVYVMCDGLLFSADQKE